MRKSIYSYISHRYSLKVSSTDVHHRDSETDKSFLMHMAQSFTMNLSHSSFWGVLLLSTTVSSLATRQNLGDCKCLPHLACWPSESEWQQLNTSVAGSLISHIRPVAAPCYYGTTEYDEQRCEEVTEMYTDSFWRADQAGE